MTVTIIQPAYLPWLGFFERVLLSDVYVVLDHVQLDTNSKTNFTNRNKIRTPQDFAWLTVPIRKKGKYGNLFIDQIEIDNESNWKHKHWNSIRQFYGKAPHFARHADFFASVYNSEHTLLVDLIKQLNDYIFDQLSITTKMVYSSRMGIQSAKDDLILDICVELGAEAYISGPFGRDYLNRDSFRDKNIKLYFHDYKHPEYKQNFPGFQPYMSVIDLLFNHGETSTSILNTTRHVTELPQ